MKCPSFPVIPEVSRILTLRFKTVTQLISMPPTIQNIELTASRTCTKRLLRPGFLFVQHAHSGEGRVPRAAGAQW